MIRKVMMALCLAVLVATVLLQLLLPNRQTLLFVWTSSEPGDLWVNRVDGTRARLKLGETRQPATYSLPVDACYGMQLADGYLTLWGPRWVVPPMPIGTTSLLFAVAAGYLIAHPYLCRHRRRKKSLCIHCGYDLTGNVSGVCPECGEAA
jgi:hypothetical protein